MSVVWLIDYSIDWRVGWSIDWNIGWSIDGIVDWSVDRSILWNIDSGGSSVDWKVLPRVLTIALTSCQACIFSRITPGGDDFFINGGIKGKLKHIN